MKINYLKLLKSYFTLNNIKPSQLNLESCITNTEFDLIKKNLFEINDIKLLVKISQLLNVSLDWLIFGEESPEYTEFHKGYLKGLSKGFREGFIYCKKLKNEHIEIVSQSVFKIQ